MFRITSKIQSTLLWPAVACSPNFMNNAHEVLSYPADKQTNGGENRTPTKSGGGN